MGDPIDIPGTKQRTAPLLALRDVVIFPGNRQDLYVGRPLSLTSLEHAMKHDRQVIFVTQRDEGKDAPGQEDLYKYGCLAKLHRITDKDNGAKKILVEGIVRVRVEEIASQPLGKSLLQTCVYTPLADESPIDVEAVANWKERLLRAFDRCRNLMAGQRQEDLDISSFVDRLASVASLPIKVQQSLLEELSVSKRAELLWEYQAREVDIDRRVSELSKSTSSDRESLKVSYLKERAADIQSALSENGLEDIEELRRKIDEAGMSEEAHDKCITEINRLASMTSMSPEAIVIRTYLEVLTDLPWRERTEINFELDQARKVLDDDHKGLDKVKQRIIEYLAVQRRVGHNRGSVMCLLGPPGVGKTSLGRSIARATGRKFVRLSLGGIHDEATIRGHRRTYVASMPGRILKSMTEAKVKNPVFMLDEIDKLDSSFSGDPMAALLEVIDPEQNGQFVDQYAEIEFDLSEVMFIATANSSDTMYAALRDRLEIINLPGYTDREKISIARQHLVPKVLAANGIPPGGLRFSEPVLKTMVREYTKEAGVRNLDRLIAKVSRKVVLEQDMQAESKPDADAATSAKPYSLTKKKLRDKLGTPLVFRTLKRSDSVGIVNGLAVIKDWEGIVHQVDAVCLPGEDGLVKTGNLLPHIEQSIDAACSILRANPGKYGLADDFLDTHQVHIHYPNIDIAHDGNSNGLALFALMVSVLNDIPVRVDTAITGAINLHGEACAIGGLREKLVGAWRERINRVIIPHLQARELAELPRDIADEMEIVTVRNVDEVLRNILVSMPKPKKATVADKKGLLVANSKKQEKGSLMQRGRPQ